jgi:uncharacterized protein (DUF2062 family)
LIDKIKWKKRLKAILSLDNHPGHIAAGFAVGVFISFSPFYGFHTLLAIIAAFVFRLNKLTCITGSWVNTPLTVPIVVGASYKLGTFLLGEPAVELSLSTIDWELVRSHAASLILGTSILGFFAALVSYFLCYYLVVRFRRKDPTLATLTAEMEEVGDNLE